jgi:flagellar hook-associated protein 3 FlgL
MRISTSMIFDAGVTAMGQQSASLLHLQQEISTGRRIITPSDDPVAASQALVVQQALDINGQYATNQNNAKSALGLEESQLSSANDLLARVKELAVQAGDGSLTPSDKQSIATELRSDYEQLLGIANAKDGTGIYLFSGYKGTTEPFSGTVDQLNAAPGNEITYSGDSGQRTLQVASSRYIETGDPGNSVFVPSGGPSVFKTIASLVNSLESSAAGTMPDGTYQANVAQSLSQVDNANQAILTVRAKVGSRLAELDALTNTNGDLNLQYSQTLSNLQDTNAVQAISDLTRTQTGLQAAQLSFSKITQLSLFNYIS